MKKQVAGMALAASLLGGAGMATVFGTPMAAFAADTTTEATAQATARTPAQWVTDALKGLVDKGTITQAQSDAVATALEEARPAGHGPGGPGGPGGRGHIASAKVAEALGISEADLRTALSSDKSIAAIAAERKVELQKVIDAVVAEENARLDEAVKNGRITQAQADAKKANTVQRVTDMVNNVRPERGLRGERPGDAPAVSPPTTTAAA